MRPIRNTPEETLKRALDECASANECLVIMTDEDGGISKFSSTSTLSVQLGLIEMTKMLIQNDVIENERHEAEQ